MESESNLDEIIVGTNEEFILGYYLSYKDSEKANLEPSFSNHAHIGRIKQVTICKNYLVTGSSDEFIKIFDLHSRKEIGSLNCHEGTINCLAYHRDGFLFSAADDGLICITDAEKWRLRTELKGHTGPVTGFAVHPSGKLGLSISKDRRVLTWNLMKGKRAYAAGLRQAGEIIKWSPNGSFYLISASNILNIYSIEHGNIVHTIDFKNNIYCFCYLKENLLVVGGERKNLVLFDLNLKTEVVQWEAHETRSKCLLLLDSDSENIIRFASASSDGFIKIWALNISEVSSPPKLIGQVNTKSRIICMASKNASVSSIPFESEEPKKIFEEKEIESSTDKKIIPKNRNRNTNRKKSKENFVKSKNLNDAKKVSPNKRKPKKFINKKINDKSEIKKDALKNLEKTVGFKKKVKKKSIQSNK